MFIVGDKVVIKNVGFPFAGKSGIVLRVSMKGQEILVQITDVFSGVSGCYYFISSELTLLEKANIVKLPDGQVYCSCGTITSNKIRCCDCRQL